MIFGTGKFFLSGYCIINTPFRDNKLLYYLPIGKSCTLRLNFISKFTHYAISIHYWNIKCGWSGKYIKDEGDEIKRLFTYWLIFDDLKRNWECCSPNFFFHSLYTRIKNYIDYIYIYWKSLKNKLSKVSEKFKSTKLSLWEYPLPVYFNPSQWWCAA